MRQKTQTQNRTGQGSALRSILICLLLLLVGVSAAYASGGPTYRHGAVYTRSLILGPSQQPIYVEYNDDGSIGTEIGEAVGPYAHAQVMSSEQYRAYLTQFEQLKTQYPELELVERDNYTSGGYTTVNGDPIGQRELDATTLVVLLKPVNQRYATDPDQLILLELPIDPSNQPPN